ncbi:MAG TPA: TIGR00159 family protein [Bacteroidales bacterium]|nr:TIGR00159 family protein [Bacteroidales bacterium]
MLNFIQVGILDLLDIFLVAVLLYEVYRLIKGSIAINLFIGISIIYFIWKLVVVLHMELLSEILGAFIGIGFIALLIVFQPEIRQFLLFFGSPAFLESTPKRLRFLFGKINRIESTLDVDKVIMAVRHLADTKTGALIVLTKKHDLRQVIDTGDKFTSEISADLIENIFFKNSPLHDGALIIRENKIVAARCILPLTKNKRIDTQLGLRHRAAVGITEQTDALAIVVSEETGEISFSKKGIMINQVAAHQLRSLLEEEFIS